MIPDDLTELNKGIVKKIQQYVEAVDDQARVWLERAPSTPREFHTEYVQQIPEYLKRIVCARYKTKEYIHPLIKSMQGYVQWKDIEEGLKAIEKEQ